MTQIAFLRKTLRKLEARGVSIPPLSSAPGQFRPINQATGLLPSLQGDAGIARFRAWWFPQLHNARLAAHSRFD